MRQLSLIEKNPALAGVIKLLASVAADSGPDERAGIYASQFFQFQYPAALAQDLRALFDQYVAEHVPLAAACEALANTTSEQTRLFLLLKLGEFTNALDRFDERFCVSRMARDYVRIYERLIGEPDAPVTEQTAPIVAAKPNGGRAVH